MADDLLCGFEQELAGDRFAGSAQRSANPQSRRQARFEVQIARALLSASPTNDAKSIPTLLTNNDSGKKFHQMFQIV